MLNFALNHMTVPSLTMKQACDLARDLGMTGLELRNDLDAPLFDGKAPRVDMIDLPVVALAEVKAFNAFDDAVLQSAILLMDLAVGCGARAISLIPKVGSDAVAPDGLRRAMIALAPELEQRGLTGLIEPIGFAHSSLRHKSQVVDLIDTLDLGAQFGLIHDTFHHHLSGESALYPAHTKLVHISGVTDRDVPEADIRDHHRVLVDGADRLGNVAQITELLRGGYTGPLSFEAFSPDVHADIDPKASLSRSIHFIENEIMALAA
ncbi:TIM barrel protein [Octadecabacter sp. G9-8]|uniref:TIM barrel protein n=1 Tax=Octadecabacter dasysiphoniae TaxID=2909341 RepID=A0ABS9CYL7_9RHOB|nr:TIM barrel protein [Octadecabacter dasysiphoniae]MCF2872375.1 TIM barrel protein [Octadecabacter dasysiphoniae]